MWQRTVKDMQCRGHVLQNIALAQNRLMNGASGFTSTIRTIIYTTADNSTTSLNKREMHLLLAGV